MQTQFNLLHILTHILILCLKLMDILNILKLYLITNISYYRSAADIDECTMDNGGCSEFADCSNTVGSFTCTCWDRYFGDGFNCSGRTKLQKRFF